MSEEPTKGIPLTPEAKERFAKIRAQHAANKAATDAAGNKIIKDFVESHKKPAQGDPPKPASP